MRRQAGFTLLDILLWLVLAAVIAVPLVRQAIKTVQRGEDTVVSQHARVVQEGVNAWIAQQPSLAGAISNFTDNGTEYVPTPEGLARIVAEMGNLFASDNDAIELDGTHVVTQALRRNNAFLTITWPKPYRSSYPRVTIQHSE